MPKTARELERIIMEDGWVFKNQRGSHRHYVHPLKTGKVTIPFHGKGEITIGTAKQILKQAGIKEEKK